MRRFQTISEFSHSLDPKLPFAARNTSGAHGPEPTSRAAQEIGLCGHRGAAKGRRSKHHPSSGVICRGHSTLKPVDDRPNLCHHDGYSSAQAQATSGALAVTRFRIRGMKSLDVSRRYNVVQRREGYESRNLFSNIGFCSCHWNAGQRSISCDSGGRCISCYELRQGFFQRRLETRRNIFN